MKHTTSVLGIGGKLTLYTSLYAGLATALTFFFPQIFIIRSTRDLGLPLLGCIFLALGIPLLIISARQVLREFEEGVLIRNGIFRYSRNPIYAAWALFLVPGLSLLTSSWIFLGTPFVFYLTFKIFIREEEEYLTSCFGQEYLNYKAETGQLFPKFRK